MNDDINYVTETNHDGSVSDDDSPSLRTMETPKMTTRSLIPD